MEDTKPRPDTDAIALQAERFSALSSEMVSLLEDLRREINRAALELQDVQAAVNAGKQELEALCEIEKETSALELQIVDLRQQKETMERFIADQRSAWEEENVRRAREEKEYESNVKNLRQKEEEEHRVAWENERRAARQKLEEELDAIRRKNWGIQAAEDRDALARRSALDKKERELALLMQELEKFLSGLAVRIGTAGQTLPGRAGGDAASASHGNPAFLSTPDDFKGGFNPGNALMWEDAGEEPGSSYTLTGLNLDD
jgi:hypothetical protein